MKTLNFPDNGQLLYLKNYNKGFLRVRDESVIRREIDVCLEQVNKNDVLVSSFVRWCNRTLLEECGLDTPYKTYRFANRIKDKTVVEICQRAINRVCLRWVLRSTTPVKTIDIGEIFSGLDEMNYSDKHRVVFVQIDAWMINVQLQIDETISRLRHLCAEYAKTVELNNYASTIVLMKSK